MSTATRNAALLIGCAVVTAALAMGLRQSFGLFLAPMTTERGWSTSGFALAIAFQVLLNGFAQPIAGQIADRLGARPVVMGGAALLMIPLAMPLGGQPAPPKPGATEQTAGEALRFALSSPSFWCLFAGFFVCGLHVSFLAVHLPGFVATCLLPPSVGAASIALIGLFNVFGSLTAGELSQRWKRRELLVGIYALRGVLMAVFLYAEKTTTSVLVFSALMGVLWLSTVPPTVALCARNWGTRWLATIFGLVFLGHQLGGFAGAFLGGYVYDRTGSYDAMWSISIAFAAFAALIHLPIQDGPRIAIPGLTPPARRST